MIGIPSTSASMDNSNLSSLAAESSSTPLNTLDGTSGLSREATEELNGVPSQADSEQPPRTMDPLLQAELFKSDGNKAFEAKLYNEAIELYSKAIGALSN